MIKAIEITTKLPCTNACKYCPQGLLNRNYEGDPELTWDTLKTMLDKVGPDMPIHFSGFGESFLHDGCDHLIRDIYNNENPVELFTTLVGMDKFDINLLELIDFERLVVHLPDDVYFKVDKKKYIPLAKYFAGRMKNAEYITVYDDHSKAREWSKLLGVEVNNEKMVSRSGEVGFVSSWLIDGAVECADNRQWQPVMLPNGDLYICCNDYGLDNKVGNIVTDSMNQIEKNIVAYEKVMADPSKRTICNKCWRACKTTSPVLDNK